MGQVAPHKKLTDNYWWNASGRLDKMGQLKNQLLAHGHSCWEGVEFLVFQYDIMYRRKFMMNEF